LPALKRRGGGSTSRRRFAMSKQGSPVIDPVLRLYIAGAAATARRAEKQLAALQAHIEPNWTVEVIDVQERPDLAEKAGILATPTLAYSHGEHSRRIVGDLGDTRRVLEFLGIEAKGKSA
jgi:circadian clock protein KaiB